MKENGRRRVHRRIERRRRKRCRVCRKRDSKTIYEEREEKEMKLGGEKKDGCSVKGRRSEGKDGSRNGGGNQSGRKK